MIANVIYLVWVQFFIFCKKKINYKKIFFFFKKKNIIIYIFLFFFFFFFFFTRITLDFLFAGNSELDVVENNRSCNYDKNL
jgi:hypothetical protein